MDDGTRGVGGCSEWVRGGFMVGKRPTMSERLEARRRLMLLVAGFIVGLTADGTVRSGKAALGGEESPVVGTEK